MLSSRVQVIDEQNRLLAACLMARLKPEWWDEAGALEQLGGGQGWLLFDDLEGQMGKPVGWLLAKALPEYRAVEIETIGRTFGGEAQVGPGLEGLLAACEAWTKQLGLACLRFVMSSRGTNLHGEPMLEPWQALRDLRAQERPELDWWIGQGFVPSGLLPNAYGPRCHGILLIKLLE